MESYGEYHSLRVRLVKGQAHLVQVGGHLQVRSGSRKKGTVRVQRLGKGWVLQNQDH